MIGSAVGGDEKSLKKFYSTVRGAVLEGRGRPLQPKSAGLPGITRQRVGLPLKIFRLNSLLLLLPLRSLPFGTTTKRGSNVASRQSCLRGTKAVATHVLHGFVVHGGVI